MNVKINPNAYFLTYPRSGKNWLSWYLDLNTDLDIDFGHYVKVDKDTPEEFFKSRMYEIQVAAEKDYSKVFSIARDPVESLASMNVMEDFSQIEFRSNQFLDHYSEMLKNNVTFFDFKDVINNTEKVAKLLCNKLGGSFLLANDDFDSYSTWHVETQDKRKTVTSKKDPRYQDHLDYIKNLPLEKHYNLYSQALEKSVTL
jgi:hypothetical protein